MKTRVSFVVGFAAVLLIATPIIAQPTCFDHPDPLHPRVRVAVDCPNVIEDPTPNTNARRNLPHLEHRDQLSYNGTDYFQVNLTCTANATLCAKVKQAFQTAGEIISGAIIFNTPIVVNATFLPFCTALGDCGTTQEITLGGSYPSRTMAMQDSDGFGRYYPQALVKQLNIANHPAYGPYDVTSMFNADASFWFDSDGPIGASQSDFLWVIIHEFMHGLGFYSNWNDYLDFTPTSLTPDLTQYDTSIASQAIINGPLVFNGFYESVFDRHLVFLSNLTSCTTLTKQLDAFNGGIGTNYASENSYYTAFLTSPQFQQGVQMMKVCTTTRSLGFMPANGSTLQDALILETSMNPFVEGSSISHVDYNTYTTSSDFLMAYLQQPGITMQQAIARGGGGPIGPRLLNVLSTLGYATSDNPNPSKSVTIIPTGTDTNIGSTSTDTSVPVSGSGSISYGSNGGANEVVGFAAGAAALVILVGIVYGCIRRRRLQSSPAILTYTADPNYPVNSNYPAMANYPGTTNYPGPTYYLGASGYGQPVTAVYYPQNQDYPPPYGSPDPNPYMRGTQGAPAGGR